MVDIEEQAITITISYFTSIYLIFAILWTYIYIYILGFVLSLTHIYYILHSLYIVLVNILYNSRGFLIFFLLDIVYILLFKIWKGHLRSPELSNYALSKNVKSRSEQPLALAYILYLYKLYRLYILD